MLVTGKMTFAIQIITHSQSHAHTKQQTQDLKLARKLSVKFSPSDSKGLAEFYFGHQTQETYLLNTLNGCERG